MFTRRLPKDSKNVTSLQLTVSIKLGRIRFGESGFRFIVNPDLDSLANRMVSICRCCQKWRHCYSFTFVILTSLPISLVNPRENWIRYICESRFVHWMDGFTESEKSEFESGFGFVKSNTAFDNTMSTSTRQQMASTQISKIKFPISKPLCNFKLAPLPLFLHSYSFTEVWIQWQ